MLKKKTTAAKRGSPAAATTKTTKKVERSAPTPKTDKQVALRSTHGPGKGTLTRASDWEQLAGAGQERMTMSDYAIPRLAILQSNSPQCVKGDGKYIDGAEPGDICDTVTGVLFDGDGGIRVLAVAYRKAHIEWVPRAKGGGFVMDHDSDASILEKCERADGGGFTLPNGNEIKVIGEYFVFVIEDGKAQKYVLGMGGTQLKKSRAWNTMMSQLEVPSQKQPGTKLNPPTWFRTYHLTTVPEKNDKGNWFGWKIEPDEFVFDLPGGDGIFEDATRFNQQIRAGQVQARQVSAEEVSEQTPGGGRDNTGAYGKQSPTEDDIRF